MGGLKPGGHVAEEWRDLGFDVPLYTVTGWDGAVYPKGEVLPVQGGYPDTPWGTSPKMSPPNEVYAFRFDSRIKVLVRNEKGVLARVAAEIGESDAHITYVGMDDDKEHLMKQLRFTVQVEDRVHLARVMRNVRRIPGVARILRER